MQIDRALLALLAIAAAPAAGSPRLVEGSFEWLPAGLCATARFELAEPSAAKFQLGFGDDDRGPDLVSYHPGGRSRAKTVDLCGATPGRDHWVYIFEDRNDDGGWNGGEEWVCPSEASPAPGLSCPEAGRPPVWNPGFPEVGEPAPPRHFDPEPPSEGVTELIATGCDGDDGSSLQDAFDAIEAAEIGARFRVLLRFATPDGFCHRAGDAEGRYDIPEGVSVELVRDLPDGYKPYSAWHPVFRRLTTVLAPNLEQEGWNRRRDGGGVINSSGALYVRPLIGFGLPDASQWPLHERRVAVEPVGENLRLTLEQPYDQGNYAFLNFDADGFRAGRHRFNSADPNVFRFTSPPDRHPVPDSGALWTSPGFGLRCDWEASAWICEVSDRDGPVNVFRLFADLYEARVLRAGKSNADVLIGRNVHVGQNEFADGDQIYLSGDIGCVGEFEVEQVGGDGKEVLRIDAAGCRQNTIGVIERSLAYTFRGASGELETCGARALSEHVIRLGDGCLEGDPPNLIAGDFGPRIESIVRARGDLLWESGPLLVDWPYMVYRRILAPRNVKISGLFSPGRTGGWESFDARGKRATRSRNVRSNLVREFGGGMFAWDMTSRDSNNLQLIDSNFYNPYGISLASTSNAAISDLSIVRTLLFFDPRVTFAPDVAWLHRQPIETKDVRRFLLDGVEIAHGFDDANVATGIVFSVRGGGDRSIKKEPGDLLIHNTLLYGGSTGIKLFSEARSDSNVSALFRRVKVQNSAFALDAEKQPVWASGTSVLQGALLNMVSPHWSLQIVDSTFARSWSDTRPSVFYAWTGRGAGFRLERNILSSGGEADFASDFTSGYCPDLVDGALVKCRFEPSSSRIADNTVVGSLNALELATPFARADERAKLVESKRSRETFGRSQVASRWSDISLNGENDYVDGASWADRLAAAFAPDHAGGRSWQGSRPDRGVDERKLRGGLGYLEPDGIRAGDSDSDGKPDFRYAAYGPRCQGKLWVGEPDDYAGSLARGDEPLTALDSGEPGERMVEFDDVVAGRTYIGILQCGGKTWLLPPVATSGPGAGATP